MTLVAADTCFRLLACSRPGPGRFCQCAGAILSFMKTGHGPGPYAGVLAAANFGCWPITATNHARRRIFFICRKLQQQERASSSPPFCADVNHAIIRQRPLAASKGAHIMITAAWHMLGRSSARRRRKLQENSVLRALASTARNPHPVISPRRNRCFVLARSGHHASQRGRHGRARESLGTFARER